MKRLHLAIYSACAAILAAEFAVTGYLWNQLPAQIPTHFNISGTPDAYSSKSFVMVFLVPAIQLAIYHLFVLLYRRPEFTNWPTTLILVTVEEKKREKMFNVFRAMDTWVLLWLSLLFAYLQFAILSTANGRTGGLENYVMLGMLAILFVILVAVNVHMYTTVRKIIK